MGGSPHLLRKISSLPSPSSLDQNQARNENQNGEDISGSEDLYPHQDIISSPKAEENRAQNEDSEDGEGSEDIFQTLTDDAPLLSPVVFLLIENSNPSPSLIFDRIVFYFLVSELAALGHPLELVFILFRVAISLSLTKNSETVLS